jgi:YVTN family beta-propeller protein
MVIWRIDLPREYFFTRVTNHGDGTVTAIDTAINQPISTIPVAVFPYGIATTPDNTRVYVASPLSKVLSVIDTNSNAVVHVIPEPFTPFQLAITPDGTRAYVTNGAGLAFGTSVFVVNLLTNTLTADIGVFITPSGIAITPDGKRAYVPNANSALLSVIDTENNVGLSPIILWFGISGVAVSHDGAKVYVANPDNGTVSVIDTSTNDVTATIQFPFGRRPKFLALTPDDSRVYVTSGGASTTPDTNRIDIIDTVSNTLTTSIPMFDYCPAGIALVNLVPHNNDDCKRGGYKKYDFPTFPNQGQCLKYVREHAN